MFPDGSNSAIDELLNPAQDVNGITLLPDTKQYAAIVTNIIFMLPFSLCLWKPKKYFFVMAFVLFSFLASNMYHYCRAKGIQQCPTIYEWQEMDFVASQFLVIVMAIYFGVHIDPFVRNAILLTWFFFHVLVFAIGYFTWISFIVSLPVGCYNFWHNWKVFDRAIVWTAFIIGGIGLGVFPVAFIELYPWFHSIWHVDVIFAFSMSLAASFIAQVRYDVKHQKL